MREILCGMVVIVLPVLLADLLAKGALANVMICFFDECRKGGFRASREVNAGRFW